MCLPVLPTRSGFGVVFAGGSVHGFAKVFADLDKAVFRDFGDGVAALGVYRRQQCAGRKKAGRDKIPKTLAARGRERIWPRLEDESDRVVVGVSQAPVTLVMTLAMRRRRWDSNPHCADFKNG
jgi:hypothetical protein